MPKEGIPDKLIEEVSRRLSSARDRDFFRRVYQTDPEIYQRRLKRIGFIGKDRILDAGSGFGQWTIALAELNGQVEAAEISRERLEASRAIASHCNANNIRFLNRSIERIEVPDEYYDAVFSYSTIYDTNYEMSLKEFHRVLRRGGDLYFSTNGLGWYIHNIIDMPNPSDDFDPREMAIRSIRNSVEYFRKKVTRPGESIVMPREVVGEFLAEIGFEAVVTGGDGTIDVSGEVSDPLSFFEASYYGEEGAYEVLCKKS